MSQATVTSKGQITLPKPIREHLKLHTGDRVEFVVGPDGAVTVRAVTSPVTVLKGMVPTPRRAVSVEEMNRAIRRRGSSRAGS